MYDVSSGRWYTETASGDVPDQRRRFCAGATWAKDRSSYNMCVACFFAMDPVSNLGPRYLYGGASINEGSGFGDTYILSLPSFTWIKVKHHNSKILRELDLLEPNQLFRSVLHLTMS
jgi:hypothetical protein